jgi:hypothetical protein
MKINITKKVALFLLPMITMPVGGVGIEPEPMVSYYQNNKPVVCTLEKVRQDTCIMLNECLERMKAANSEVIELYNKKGSERKKEHFWTVFEITDNTDSVKLLRLDFLSQNGPLHMGIKRIYKSKSLTGEIPDGGYTIYYSENGNIMTFLPRGKKITVLSFYPSGKLKSFSVGKKDDELCYIEWNEYGNVISTFNKPIPSSLSGSTPAPR